MIASLMAALSLATAQPSATAWAQAPPTVDLNPHFQYTTETDPALLKNKVSVHERIITHDGVQYKEIEYEGEFYYVNARQPEAIVNCDQTPLPPNTYAVDSSVKITQYTRLFIQTLRQHCVGDHVVTSPNGHDTNLGVSWKSNDSEKKVFINPLKKTGGFGTTF